MGRPLGTVSRIRLAAPSGVGPLGLRVAKNGRIIRLAFNEREETMLAATVRVPNASLSIPRTAR